MGRKIDNFIINRKFLIGFFLALVSVYILFIYFAYVDIYEKDLKVAENYLELENYKIVSGLDVELSKLSNRILFLRDSKGRHNNINKDLRDLVLDSNRLPNEFNIQDIYITNKKFLVKSGTNENLINLKQNFENPIDDKYIWFSKLIKKHNTIEGYVFFNIERKTFDNFIKSLGMNSNIKQCISDSSGNIIYVSEYINAKNTKDLFVDKAVENKRFYSDTDCYNRSVNVFETKNNDFGLVFYTVIESNSVVSFSKIPEKLLLVTLICFLIVSLFLIMLVPSIKDYNELVAFAEQISIGNTNMKKLKVKSRKLKKMEIALNRTLRNVNYLSNGILKTDRCVKKGDLRNILNDLQTSGSYYNALYNVGEITSKFINYLDYLDIPVLILNKHFNILYANKATSEISFLRNEKIENQSFFTSFNLADIVNGYSILEKAYNTKKSQSSITDLYLETKIIRVKYFAKPILDKRNNFVSMLVCFLNISDIEKQVSEVSDYGYINDEKIISINKFDIGDFSREGLI